jgi:hypothetical protein
VLAVEVAGKDEDESALRAKAAWYLGVGAGGHHCRSGETRPLHPALPDLTPCVGEFFPPWERVGVRAARRLVTSISEGAPMTWRSAEDDEDGELRGTFTLHTAINMIIIYQDDKALHL